MRPADLAAKRGRDAADWIEAATGNSVLAVPGDQALRQLLAAGAWRGIEILLGRQIRKTGQIQLSAGDALAELAIPTLVALLLEAIQRAIRDDIGGRQQGARDRI